MLNLVGFIFWFDFTYILIMLPFLLLAGWAAMRVKSTFAKYSQVPSKSGLTGKEAAEIILRASGIYDVTIRPVPGLLSDHYNPMNKTLNLSPEVLNGRSIAAIGVAAHEAGHAIQHARAYAPLQIRAALVPIVGFGSSLAFPMFLFGILFHIKSLILIGVIFYSLAVVFHLVTLPVEYDASWRAIKILESSGILTEDEIPPVKKVLSAAGFTYVAATLVAIAELLYWVLRSGLLGGEE